MAFSNDVETIGSYVVERFAGEDAIGRAYDARDVGGAPVMLEVLHAELTRTPDVRAKLIAEFEGLSRLAYPGIVRCHCCVEIEGAVVLVFDRVQGQSLRDRLLHGGRLRWYEALDIGVRVAQALAVAHGSTPPIVHRDLRPENVLATADGGVIVQRFGFSKVLGVAGQTTTAAFGNIKYMSPEQIDACGIDARSDIYGLGLLLFELVTGDVPFSASSPRELLNAQCIQPPPPFSAALQAEVPADFERLLRHMLEKQAMARPQSAAHLVGLMQSVLHGQPIQLAAVAPIPGALGPTAHGPPVAPVTPRVVKRSTPVAAIAAAVVGVVGIGSVAAYLGLASRDDGTLTTAAAQTSASAAPRASAAPTAATPQPDNPKPEPSTVVQPARPQPIQPQPVPTEVPEEPVPEEPVPEEPVPEEPVPEEPVPEEPVPEEPVPEKLTKQQKIGVWVRASLRGHDNRVAAFRTVDISRGGGGFKIFIKNQFKFTCDLDFDNDGNPSRLRNCKSGDPPWGAKQKRITLTCTLSEKKEVCRGKYTLVNGSFSDPSTIQIVRRLPKKG